MRISFPLRVSPERKRPRLLLCGRKQKPDVPRSQQLNVRCCSASLVVNRSYDSSYLCSCGQAKIPRRCLRRDAAETGAGAGAEIERLAARWAASEGVAEESVCCCNVWNMVVVAPTAAAVGPEE